MTSSTSTIATFEDSLQWSYRFTTPADKPMNKIHWNTPIHILAIQIGIPSSVFNWFSQFNLQKYKMLNYKHKRKILIFILNLEDT